MAYNVNVISYYKKLAASGVCYRILQLLVTGIFDIPLCLCDEANMKYVCYVMSLVLIVVK